MKQQERLNKIIEKQRIISLIVLFLVYIGLYAFSYYQDEYYFMVLLTTTYIGFIVFHFIIFHAIRKILVEIFTAQ